LHCLLIGKDQMDWTLAVTHPLLLCRWLYWLLFHRPRFLSDTWVRNRYAAEPYEGNNLAKLLVYVGPCIGCTDLSEGSRWFVAERWIARVKRREVDKPLQAVYISVGYFWLPLERKNP